MDPLKADLAVLRVVAVIVAVVVALFLTGLCVAFLPPPT